MERNTRSEAFDAKISTNNHVTAVSWMQGFSENTRTSLHQICAILKENIEIEAVYCLGYRNTLQNANSGVFIEKTLGEQIHFYLVVFVKKMRANSFAKLNKKIRKNVHDKTVVTLLIHPTASLHEIERSQYYFFHSLFEHGNLAYQNREVHTLLNALEEPKQNYDYSRIYLYARNAVALDYLEALTAVEKNGCTMTSAVLIHLATEHICLMLIYALLGYHPQNFSTEHLFELCDYTTGLTKEIFPRNTPHEQELFDVLCIRPRSVRYANIDAVHYRDLQIVASRCREFQSRAFKLALDNIELLKI